MLKRVFASTFLRHNAILFAGAIAVGALNYLFYPIIGRLLSPAMFGEVQAVISLFLQLSMFLTVINIVTIFVVTNYTPAERRNGVLLELEKVAMIIVGLVALAVMMLSGPISAFFHFGSAWPFALLSIMLVFTVPFTFRTSYLRGKQKFMASNLAQLVAAGGRFVFSIPLVLLGGGSVGALGGVALSQGVALGFGSWRAFLAGLHRPKGFRLFAWPRVAAIGSEIRYSLLVFVGSLAVMLLLTIDTLAAKHLFDTHTAGLYAGVATASRIIFFLTASIAQSLLPAVRLDAPVGHNRRLLVKSLILFAVIGLPVVVFFSLFPGVSLTLLMGSEYAAMSSLLPLLSLTIGIISVLNLIVSYFLTLKAYIPSIFAIIGFAVALGLMFFHHQNPQAIVESLFVGSMVSMCLIAVWLARARLVRRSNDETTTTLHRGPSAQ